MLIGQVLACQIIGLLGQVLACLDIVTMYGLMSWVVPIHVDYKDYLDIDEMKRGIPPYHPIVSPKYKICKHHKVW